MTSHKSFGSLFGRSKKNGEGSDMAGNALDQSPPASGIGPSVTQADGPESQELTTGRTGRILDRLVPHSKRPSTRSVTPTPQPVVASHAIEQTGDAEETALDAFNASGPSITQVQASGSEQSSRWNARAKFRDIFPGSRTPKIRPTTPTLQPITVSPTGEQELPKVPDVEEVVAPGKLVSKRANEVSDAATETNDKKVALLDLGIGAIDLLRQVSDVVGLTLPNPVGPVLEKVTAVLGTLKQMIENKSAWQGLLRTLDNHQQVFNQQLARLKKDNLDADPASPFLGPVKKYSIALEEILAAIIKEGGLTDKDTSRGGAWEKVKNFSSRFMNAGSEQGQIQAYERQLSDAMSDLKLALVLYISDKVQEISDKMTSNEETAILATLKLTDLQYGSPLAGCMEGTRLDILEKIDEWTTDFDAPNILWLKGHPGVGKSAIATNLVEQLRTSKRLGSSFFFQRQKAAGMTANVLWCTVAYNLARKYYTIRDPMVIALKDDETIPNTVNIDKLFRLLIEQPITASEDIPNERLPVVVIDALDECGGLDGQQSDVQRNVMQSLAYWPRLPSRFKLVVTSRDETDIARVFSRTKHQSIELSAGPKVTTQSSVDIRKFLTHQLQHRVVDRYEDALSPDWPGAQIVEELAEKAAGLFIWANTVVNFISLGEPQQRLNMVLEGSGTGDMGALYSQVLNTSFPHPTEGEIDSFHRVVGTVILAKEPLSSVSLRQLHSMEAPVMRHICNGLHSVLESQDTLRFHHQSFVDFLMDPDRCPATFLIKEKRETQHITLACLRVMKETLRFNICDLKSSYLRNSDVPNIDSQIEQYIPHHLSYSSHFWASHLTESTFHVDIFEGLQHFMGNQFLFWLEVLSLTKRVNLTSSMLLLLIDWLRASGQDDAMARDMRRFVAGFASVIAQSAPHIYLSALPFSPPNSAVSKQYRAQFSRTLAVQRGGLSSWPAIQHVLLGHTASVNSVACSADGRRIISGSGDEKMRVWDASTGEVLAGPFTASSSINSVAISSDGSRLASGCNDGTVQVWDAETGKVLAGPFEERGTSVNSVAFSPNGRHIISGSSDCTIRLWDTEMSEPLLRPLKGHSEHVSSVTFSPDGKRIASGSWDETVRVWGTETGELVVGPLRKGGGFVSSIAFSPDGMRIAAGDYYETIWIWNTEMGEAVIGPLEGHHGWINSVAFSPDGTRIVSGSDDRTIRVWDAETGDIHAGPFYGHTGPVNTVAFFPDGNRVASGSIDGTICIWDVEMGHVDTGPFEGHSSAVQTVAFSPDGTKIVSGSSDHTICVWDAKTSERILGPLEGHSNMVNSITFSPDGTRIASGSDDRTIRVWDAKTGEGVPSPLKGHSSFVWSVAFSPDGTRIVSGSGDETIRVWDVETGKERAVCLKGHGRGFRSVSFSPNGKHILSGSDDSVIRVFDADTGEIVAGPFSGHRGFVYSASFSPDGTRIVSGAGDWRIRVWGVETGEIVVEPLKGHSGAILSVEYSADGQHLVSGSADRTIRVWDAGTGEMIAGPFNGHNQEVKSVAFSPDGKSIVSGSDDATIRVWGAMMEDSKAKAASFPAWSNMSDGWILGPNAELLFWVPPSLRDGLWWPKNHVVIGKLTTKLDLVRSVHGESWSQCRG